MLRKIALGTLALFAGSLAVSAAPKDDVEAAAKKLADTSYSWKQTTENPGAAAGGQGGQGGQGRGRGGFGGGGNMTGKVEKGGFAHLSRTMNVQGEERTTEAYVKDGKGAYKGQEGWMGFGDQQPAGDGGGRGRGGAAGFRNAVLPAAQAAELASKTKDLKAEGDAISGELTEEGAKSLLSFGGGGRRGGQGGQAGNFTPPEVKNPKGTVKYWIKDGVLAKYQYNVQGSMTFNDNDININRTTTVEISNVGSTKVTVPDEAKNKVS